MNRNILLLALMGLFMVASCSKKGCTDPLATNYDSDAKKNDGSCAYEEVNTDPPSITLNGQDTVIINLGESYTEEGATATDADGSNLDVTTDNTDLDTTQAGTYEITYSATNANGTTSVTRVVIIQLTAANIFGSYTHDSDCSATAFPLQDAAFVAAGANFEFMIEDAFNLIAGDIIGVVDNNIVTIPSQIVVIEAAGFQIGEITFDGTGTINPSATVVTITFNYDNTAPIGGTGTCTATYTMQ